MARLPQAPQSLESTLVSLFNDHPADYRRLQPRILQPKRLSPRYAAQLDFTSSDSVAEQAIEKKLIQPLVLDIAALTVLKPDELTSYLDKVLRLRKPPVVAPPPDGAAAMPAVRQAKELHLMIKRVRCVQQVGWEISDWDGVDRILCGGLGFDSLVDVDTLDAGGPSTVHYRKVPKFVVGNFPRNSSTKTYDPHKSFCKWNLQSPGAWPRFFTAFIEMAEHDTGKEFVEFLELLWEQIAPKVIDLVEKLFIAAVTAGGTGAVAGGIGGWLAGPGGAVVAGIVGAVAGAAIGALIALFKDSTEDDILESSDNPVSESVDSLAFRFDGRSTTSVMNAEYVRPGASGVYHVQYYWKLVY